MFIWLGRRRPVSVERLVSWHVIRDLIDSSASFDITDNGAREILTLGKSELLGLLIFFHKNALLYVSLETDGLNTKLSVTIAS